MNPAQIRAWCLTGELVIEYAWTFPGSMRPEHKTGPACDETGPVFPGSEGRIEPTTSGL
jgi:hypothetical protein